jgi:hypothetical protein
MTDQLAITMPRSVLTVVDLIVLWLAGREVGDYFPAPRASRFFRRELTRRGWPTEAVWSMVLEGVQKPIDESGDCGERPACELIGRHVVLP